LLTKYFRKQITFTFNLNILPAFMIVGLPAIQLNR